MVKNKVQLITYPDSLGGNLKALKSNLDTYFPNLLKVESTFCHPTLLQGTVVLHH